MAAVWITEIHNYSQYDFVIRNNDRTWRPIINGYRYAEDEPIRVRARRDEIETIFLPPWNIPISVPPGPTLMQCQYFFVGWTDFARTRIEGPEGLLDTRVGPKGLAEEEQKLDSLRIFDEQENEVESVAIGPRGSGFIASVDLHLNFDDDKVRWVIWNANGVGGELLERADKAFLGPLAELLAKKLLGGLFGGGG
jgi:hypothetical protein